VNTRSAFSGSFPLLRSKLPAVLCNWRLASDLVIAAPLQLTFAAIFFASSWVVFA
jgi:hypothetical protein